LLLDWKVYLVFARKYRPQRFQEVVGQAHVARTLQNAVRADRVAHAYLFCGGRGIGKTSMARILAKALNCAQGPTPEPCCECESCRRIAVGEDLDVMEIDGASNRGIEQVRELRQKVGYAPAHSRFKVYYVDEVHMLTQPAFNALLKTLEEPPAHVKFIFSTTDPQQLPDTVKSRCQRFDFRRISDADMIAHLRGICEKEALGAEKGSLETIARAARGSLRDALSTLDQVAALGERQVRTQDVLMVLGAARTESLTEIVDALAQRQTGKALSLLGETLFGGVDLIDFIDQLSEYLRDLLVAACCGPDDGLLAGSPAGADVLARQCELFSQEQIVYAIQILREAKLRARRDTTGRVALEVAIVKLSRLDDLIPLEQALTEPNPGAGPGSSRAVAEPRPRAESRPAGQRSTPVRRIRQKLENRNRAVRNNAVAAAPEGIDPGKLRAILSSAPDPTVAEQAREAPALLKAFAEADRVIGLQPVRLERQPEENKAKDETVPEETEQ